MSLFIWILAIILSAIGLTGILYTVSLGKSRKALRGEFDTHIDEKVQEHPYMRNPIFLAYILFFGLLLVYIIYFAITRY
ncbi:hypothetical protein [Peribacillus alkalitolerans]|uniref:hypothetical protein n=1 Tax=Peribacillus alkalitolerans TaxID=1550385 RepID=UPI0013D374DE|nr:hypothetical protein [Peribacillus alkalitolerans]